MQTANGGSWPILLKNSASVIADKGLSTYGHNIKIVAVNGTVTSNGVVHSGDEKTAIREKATAVTGSGHVVDKLKVAP